MITALSRSEVQDLLDLVDIVTGCASKHVRDLVKPLAQVGTAIPPFALTQSGKELVIERAKEIETPVLINTMPLPVLPEQKQPSYECVRSPDGSHRVIGIASLLVAGASEIWLAVS